jgi:hypothetical protein
MEEGKEFLRSFGDLLQFHQKKKEQPKPADDAAATGNANGASQDSSEPTSGELHESEQSSGS